MQELQKAFNKKKVDRFIDVDKLSKRSFQTNMEFIQFMKCYWDMHAPNGGGVPDGMAPLADHTANDSAAATAAPSKKAAKEEAAPARAVVGGPRRAPPASKAAAGARDGGAGGAGPSAGATPPAASSAAQQQLALEVTELKLSVENLERERDFYYAKLREVEVMCQNNEGAHHPFLEQASRTTPKAARPEWTMRSPRPPPHPPLLVRPSTLCFASPPPSDVAALIDHLPPPTPCQAQVLEILYKTDDADEFISPEDAQAAVPVA